MKLEKYKNKNWEELNETEKTEWEKFAAENQKNLSKFKFLSELKKCWACKTKFENGILNKNPYSNNKNLIEMIKGDFLFHLKSTHGIDWEILNEILNEK